MIEDYKVDLKRIEYAVEETVASVEASSLPAPAKQVLIEDIPQRAAPARANIRQQPPTTRPHVASGDDAGNLRIQAAA